MRSCSVISLTTDFGLEDWFVGTMKGVLLGIHPEARLIDITHAIPPGDIRAAAFALAATYRFFPKGTVHLAVVDPGVGSQRRAVAVQTENYFFVGPDNGLLSWALRTSRIRAIHALENEKRFLRPVSQTFHGRDIFAPVAAFLSCGISIEELGPRLKDIERIEWPKPRRRRHGVEGEVVYLDHFGNAITNIEEKHLEQQSNRPLWVSLDGKRLCGLSRYYQSAAKGMPVALIGSSGFLELAVNTGSAVREFGLKVGDPVACVAGSGISSGRKVGSRFNREG